MTFALAKASSFSEYLADSGEPTALDANKLAALITIYCLNTSGKSS